MLKGDALWSTPRKRILGWDLDTQAGTLALQPHCLDRLYKLMDRHQPPVKSVSVKFWHKLLGELCSMSPVFLGARGLFSILQESLQRASHNHVRITTR